MNTQNVERTRSREAYRKRKLSEYELELNNSILVMETLIDSNSFISSEAKLVRAKVDLLNDIIKTLKKLK